MKPQQDDQTHTTPTIGPAPFLDPMDNLKADLRDKLDAAAAQASTTAGIGF